MQHHRHLKIGRDPQLRLVKVLLLFPHGRGAQGRYKEVQAHFADSGEERIFSVGCHFSPQG